MWTAVKDFSQLVADGRWKVEFFSGELEIAPDSAHPLVTLSSLVDESRLAVDPQDAPDRLYNYLGMENVESLTGDLLGFSPRPGSEIRSRSKVFKEGNVLYGRLRPYLNKVYLARGQVAEGICSGEFFVLVPHEARVRPIVLRYLLASKLVVDHLARFQSGAALPRVPVRDLLGIKVPLPPMDAQGHLESALVAYEDRRRSLRKELDRMPSAAMDALTQSLRDGRPLVAI